MIKSMGVYEWAFGKPEEPGYLGVTAQREP